MKKRIAEPVQVYLEPPERRQLERLARQLETSKSDILRRGLEALERQLLDPDMHPALRVIGIADERDRATSIDPAVEHDRLLADTEELSWKHAALPKRKQRKRRAR